ncbi:hypothetical protein ABVK25_000035 [Lepraria finkii]|uniref:F-box domain-containing protein n=1 Tax=Lepraria finkii TaxID=1340010 RepID=A0ABR4BPQ4_9LECA
MMPASFSELPVELKFLVWSYIDYDYPSNPFQRESVSLVPYACVSREWQLAFERLTFRKIVIRSSQVSRFKEYIVGHRMASLRTLRFRIIIPNSDAYDSVSGTQWDNIAFTRSVKDLWAILKSIEDGYPKPQALKLRVHLSAQPRNFREDPLDFVDDRNLDEVDEADRVAEISNRLPFKSTRIPQDLPPIPWVDGFIWSSTFRGIHGAALGRLVSRFHGLTYFEVHLSEVSTQIRSDVARGMSNLSLPRLSELVFNFDVHYEVTRLPNISSHSSDALSMAVHRLLQSPNLLKVTLGDPNLNRSVRFTPELFWPQLQGFEVRFLQTEHGFISMNIWLASSKVPG